MFFWRLWTSTIFTFSFSLSIILCTESSSHFNPIPPLPLVTTAHRLTSASRFQHRRAAPLLRLRFNRLPPRTNVFLSLYIRGEVLEQWTKVSISFFNLRISGFFCCFGSFVWIDFIAFRFVASILGFILLSE